MIFPEYDNNCGWYETLTDISDYPPLKGESAFNTVVIGCGFVGTAAARRLAENQPDNRILLLDALKAGQGASGRNSGFIIDLPHKHELEKRDLIYQENVLRLNRMAIDFLENLVNTHDIKCQWSRAGKYQAAVGSRGEKQLTVYKSLMSRLGVPYKEFNRSELKGILGTEFYSSAIYTASGILMQPAALMRGVVDSMPDNVCVSEQVRVLNIQRENNGFLLHLNDNAIVRCENVVLATNAFTAEFGYMQHNILPIMTFASWTRPLTDSELTAFGGTLNWGITPADHAGTTVRMTQDRRLIIRNGHRYAYDYNTPTNLISIKKRHRKSLIERYPALSEVPFEHTWGGTGSLSINHEPFVGELAPGVFSAGCDQLVGAARGTIAGLMLADLIAGKQSEELYAAHSIFGSPGRLPPKSLLRLAVPMRLRLTRFLSRAEI